jgi:hypothetical protein
LSSKGEASLSPKRETTFPSIYKSQQLYGYTARYSIVMLMIHSSDEGVSFTLTQGGQNNSQIERERERSTFRDDRLKSDREMQHDEGCFQGPAPSKIKIKRKR